MGGVIGETSDRRIFKKYIKNEHTLSSSLYIIKIIFILLISATDFRKLLLCTKLRFSHCERRNNKCLYLFGNFNIIKTISL